jgi:hypothetical protein
MRIEVTAWSNGSSWITGSYQELYSFMSFGIEVLPSYQSIHQIYDPRLQMHSKALTILKIMNKAYYVRLMLKPPKQHYQILYAETSPIHSMTCKPKWYLVETAANNHDVMNSYFEKPHPHRECSIRPAVCAVWHTRLAEASGAPYTANGEEYEI